MVNPAPLDGQGVSGRPPGFAPPEVYRQGWSAALAGNPRSENPYSGSGTLGGAWLIGYEDAMAEREKDAPHAA